MSVLRWRWEEERRCMMWDAEVPRQMCACAVADDAVCVQREAKVVSMWM